MMEGQAGVATGAQMQPNSVSYDEKEQSTPMAPQQQMPPQPKVDSPNSNLIINFIPRAMDDKQLQQLFAPYGEIESVKIVMERGTGQHLGYGFVKFTRDDQAAQAIQALNGFPVGEKTLKVGVARPRNETGRRSNLYVSGLPENWNADQLKTMFAPWGTIIECRVLYDKNGQSRKVGFVRYEINSQAETAIQHLHNQIPSGQAGPIYVKHAAPPASKQQNAFPANISGQEYMAMASLMAQNPQAFNAMAAQLAGTGMFPNNQQQFQQQSFGYQRNRMMFNPRQRFNPMAQQPGAAFGANPFQQPQMQNHNQDPNNPSNCIFVFHLPHEATEDELRVLFSPFGQITSIKIMIHPMTKKPKGFGFVNYMRHEEAERAINALDGHQMGNKYLKLSFKK